MVLGSVVSVRVLVVKEGFDYFFFAGMRFLVLCSLLLY